MGGGAVLKRFEDLGICFQGAPDKPLLVLYALGRWQSGRKEIGFRHAEWAPGCGSIAPVRGWCGSPRKARAGPTAR